MLLLTKPILRPSRSAVALAVTGILATAGAWAAEEELTEVVVTASRREESLSKVPISVAAISREQMDLQGLKEIDNIARYTPGLKLDRAGNGGNNISIRGISSGAGAGTTGVYIDDTPIQVRNLAYSSGNLFPTLFDLERVEVLRGPQGTLFGAGSEGGTVRFIQTQPSVTNSSLYARAEYAVQDGGDPLYELGAAYGAPLVEGRAGFRVSAFYRKEGGYVDGVYGTPTVVDPSGNAGPQSSATFSNVQVLRPDMNSNSTLGFRGALKLQVTEDLSVTPSVTYQKSERDDGFDGFWEALSSKGHYARPVYSATPASSTNRFTTLASPDEDIGKDTFTLPQLAINWDAGPVSLTSNTSYFDRKFTQYFDFTNYYVGFYAATPTKFPRPGDKSSSLYDNRQKNFVQEVRLQSNDNDARLTWVAGLYFQEAKQRGIQDIGENFLVKAPRVGWFFLPTFLHGVNDGAPYGPGSTAYQNWFGVQPDANTSSIWSIDFNAKDTQYAAFAETQFKITEKLKLIAGARFSRNKVDFNADYASPENNLNAPLAGLGVVPPIAPAYSTVAVRTAENAFTPKVGLSYQIDDRNMVYATAAKGFRPPGASQRLPLGCNQDLIDLGYVDGSGNPTQKFRYTSDTVWSYELGTKNRLFDNRLSIDASAYQIRWNNIQTSVFLPNCAESFVDNGSKAKSQGFDIGLQLRAFAALSLTTNVGYNKTTFTADFLPPGGAPAINEKGDYLNGSPPEWVYSVSPQYDFQLPGDRPLFVRLDLSGSSQARATQALNGRPPIAGYGLLSARIGTQIAGAEVQLFANNLTNKAPDLTLNRGGLGGGFQNAFWTNSTVRPRTFGLFVSYRQ